MSDLVFFVKKGEKGLTSTSANYIAEKSKEHISSLELELNSIRFVDISVGKLDADEGKEKKFTNGVDRNYIDNLENKIFEIAKFKSLSAWLRESLKAKSLLAKEINLLTVENYVKMFYPDKAEQLVKPQLGSFTTFENEVANLSIKERNQFFTLEAHASTIGSLIHPSNPFSRARKELVKSISNPREITNEDMGIYKTYTPTVSLELVEEKNAKLMDLSRHYNRQLNEIKYKIETLVSEKNLETQRKYNEELTEYNSKLSEIYSEFEAWKMKELKAIQSLKIAIPNDLQDAFNFLNEKQKK